MEGKKTLESAVYFLISNIPGPMLAKFSKKAFKIEVDHGIRYIAGEIPNNIRCYPVSVLDLDERLILGLYKKFEHLIPDTYKNAGIDSAKCELDNQRMYHDPKSGKFYSL